MYIYHLIAFGAGFLLDMLLGDPYWMTHPVRLIGRLVTWAERKLLNNDMDNKDKFKQGLKLVLIVSGCTIVLTSFILGLSYYIHPYIGLVTETVMTYQIIAAKCLKVESMKVYNALKSQKLDDARKAVSMIVGRDTMCLDEEGVAKAAIETVAENTSDGVIAPMIYTAAGGPVLGFLYKAVNTMDSMVGYKNDKYLYFGRAAARLDDFVNFMPARISAAIMIAAVMIAEFLAGGECFSSKRALAVYSRDRRNHSSPNSAHTEAVCAGALGIQLAGNAVYFGKLVEKPFIGDAVRSVETEDIRRANRLMYLSAWISELICLCGMSILYNLALI